MVTMAKTGSLRQAKLKIEIQSYLLIGLQLVGFFVFSLYPILWVFRYGFYDYDGITATWCGLENFVRAFTRDALYWRSVINTFIIAYGKLIIEIPLAFLVALALTSGLVKLKRVFMVGFYLPNTTGIAVNCLIFTYMFATINGPINNILLDIGVINESVAWLGTKWTALAVIMIRSIISERCKMKHDEVSRLQKMLNSATARQQMENTQTGHLREIYDTIRQIPGKFTEYNDEIARQMVNKVKILSEEKAEITLFNTVKLVVNL